MAIVIIVSKQTMKQILCRDKYYSQHVRDIVHLSELAACLTNNYANDKSSITHAILNTITVITAIFGN